MYSYLYTNDMRISLLLEAIQETSSLLLSGQNPYDVDKSFGNNGATTQFYFNLQPGTKTLLLGASNPKECTRNFILKFQFPNTRTPDSFNDSIKQNVLLAPFRSVISILYEMSLSNANGDAFLSLDEVLYFVFCNKKICENPSVNYKKVINDILNGRSLKYGYSALIEQNIQWNQCTRQVREMMTVLHYAFESFYIKKKKVHFSISAATKYGEINDILHIMHYHYMWYPSNANDFNLSTLEYISYMDTKDTPYNVIDFKIETLDEKSTPTNLPLQQIFYGAPGTGKSFEVDDKCKRYKNFRTTFHPDYDYSTFVGCYKPTVDENNKITYSFRQQIFMDAYIEAWKRWHLNNGITPKQRNSGSNGSYSDFEYELLKVSDLSPAEKETLLKVDNLSYPFVGFDNFGDLHKCITVVVTDKPNEEQSKQFEYKIDKEELEKRLNELTAMLDNPDESIDKENLHKAIGTLGELLKVTPDSDGKITVSIGDKLLGLYDPKTKTVYLFKGIIDSEKLLVAVYVHEMFHAYFHCAGSTYIPEIEEPIVEFNTLEFLNKYDQPFFDAYKQDVESKQLTPFGYYGFGAALYDEMDNDWIENYYDVCRYINASFTVVQIYVNMFHPIYPFLTENRAVELLKKILTNIGKHISKDVYLIIEEINRGNCAQIFGDIFQLLDRDDDGYSKYAIKPDADLEKYIKSQNLKLSGVIVGGKDVSSDLNGGRIMLLPNNLYLRATMNTSDQSLFPMDSAFKRRWEWKYVPIECGEDNKWNEKGWKIEISKSESEDWWNFIEKINEVIYDLTKSEDKQLGYFFCKPDKEDGKTISADRFINKVIFYLWNDVFKDYEYEPDCCKDKPKSSTIVKFSDFHKYPETSLKNFFNILMGKKETVESDDKADETPQQV